MKKILQMIATPFNKGEDPKTAVGGRILKVFTLAVPPQEGEVAFKTMHVNPGVEIPEDFSVLVGIWNSDVEGKAKFKSLWTRLKPYIADSEEIIVASVKPTLACLEAEIHRHFPDKSAEAVKEDLAPVVAKMKGVLDAALDQGVISAPCSVSTLENLLRSRVGGEPMVEADGTPKTPKGEEAQLEQLLRCADMLEKLRIAQAERKRLQKSVKDSVVSSAFGFNLADAAEVDDTQELAMRHLEIDQWIQEVLNPAKLAIQSKLASKLNLTDFLGLDGIEIRFKDPEKSGDPVQVTISRKK